MKKQIILWCLSIPLTFGANAQYYYKDIISNRQAKDELIKLKDRKVKTVKITSFDGDGSVSKGFFCERKLLRNFSTSELYTRTEMSPASVTTTEYNTDGKLISSVDSSEISTTRIQYTYDEDGRLLSIASKLRSADDDFVNELKENHIYIYSEDFYPDKMLRIMNGIDTTIILFSKDDAGNISIEKDTRSGNTYYYYYDSRSRLTDIVHRSEYKENLIPDYMFEYDESGNISQMISTEEGGSYYYIWKYTYENDLRKKEACYSKERILLGTINYEYR